MDVAVLFARRDSVYKGIAGCGEEGDPRRTEGEAMTDFIDRLRTACRAGELLPGDVDDVRALLSVHLDLVAGMEAERARIESLSRRLSAAEQERDAAVERARMQAGIAARATDELVENEGVAKVWRRRTTEAEAERDAWRARFPGYRYRPQDDCVELEQKA